MAIAILGDRDMVVSRGGSRSLSSRADRLHARLVTPGGSTALALALYLAISFVYFGIPVVPDPSTRYVGVFTPDPPTHMWFLAWWPHAITQLVHPILTDVVFAPDGVNLAWATSIPGPALLLAPVTLAFGPIVSYNLLMVASPALSAWTAFLLCRYLTRSFWPSFAGGYLFGFSTYELGHLLGSPNLVVTFLVPLLVLLVLRRIDDDISERRFVLFFALAALGQFLVSAELSLTAALFGFGLLLFALVLVRPPIRRAIRRTFGSIVKAGVLAALLASPFLFYALTRDVPLRSIRPLEDNSSDLLNLVVPTPITLIGPHRPFGNLAEHTAYVGVPLLVALALYGFERRRTLSTKLVLPAFCFFVLASLGPVLHVNRQAVEELPWKLLADVLPWKLLTEIPLLNSPLPGRFMLYAFLAAAIGIALWLAARTRVPQAAKWLLVLFGLVLLLPDLRPSSSWWRTDISIPPFFADGLYRDYVARGDTVLVIPFGACGQSMLWHAESDMYFKIVGGYIDPGPRRFVQSPTVKALFAGVATQDARRQLPRYLAEHDVRAVFVLQGTKGEWSELFAPLGKPVAAGGVEVYAVPPSLSTDPPGQSVQPGRAKALRRCHPGAWSPTGAAPREASQ